MRAIVAALVALDVCPVEGAHPATYEGPAHVTLAIPQRRIAAGDEVVVFAGKGVKELFGSPTFRYVLAFAKRMEEKLARNRYKGDRDGWMKLSREELVDLMQGEIEEWLRAEVGRDSMYEAADIANIAMMIADHDGVLEDA